MCLEGGTCPKARDWLGCCCSRALRGFNVGCWLERGAHLWRQPHAVVPVHVWASQLPALPPVISRALNGTPAATEHYLAGWCLSWNLFERLQPSRNLLACLPSPDSLGMAAAASCCCGVPLNACGHVYLRCKCLKNCFVCGSLNKRWKGRHMVGLLCPGSAQQLQLCQLFRFCVWYCHKQVSLG